MKCGQAEKWMDAALDERSGGVDLLPASWTAQRRTELETHLAGCAACRTQWQVLCSAEAVLRVPKPVLAPETLLADFRQRLAAEELHEAQRKTPAPRRPGAGWRWLWPLGSLAAAGAAAAAVFMFNIQAPMSSIQEIRGTHNRGYELARPQAAAPSPTPERRKVAAAPSSPSWFKVKTAPGAAPQPEQMAAAPQLTETLRPVTPPTQLADNLDRRAAPPLAYVTQPEAESRGLNRSALSQLRPKDAQASDALPNENKLATEAAPVRSLTSLAAKPTLAKEHAEVADKMAAFGRGRLDANEGTQKQLLDVAGGAAQSNSAAKQQNFGVNLYTNNTAQAAVSNDFYYAQVPSEPTPVELTVSAAVLNALQRPVELRTANVRVEDLAQQLALEADVELKVDPQVARLSVTIDEAGVPLWRVLEDVARQTQMEIYPRENTLVLRLARPATLALGLEPASKAETKRSLAEKSKKDLRYARAPNVAQDAKPAAAPITVAPPAPPAPAPPAPAGVAGPAGGGGPSNPKARGAFGSLAERGNAGENPQARGLRVTPPGAGTTRYVFAHRQPDRKIWPAAWGNLPERGFEVPTAEELPPLILAPVQVGQSLRNEVPQVRLRRSETETLGRKKAPAKR
jgi:hypothetical protein